MHILLIEDDDKTAQYIRENVTSQGHLVDWSVHGAEGLNRALQGSYDVLIIDRMLPGMDGLEVIRRLREAKKQTPILVLSALSLVDDRVAGLRSGGDDYLTKPFEAAELMLRVDALLQRSRLSNNARFSKMGFELIPEKTSVKHKGNEIVLTGLEYRLLEFLLRRTNQILSTDNILNSVWRDEENASPEALAACISRLRKKLGSTGEQSIIKNVHGRGYQITTEAQ